jgi:hypothetical protein
MLISLNEEDIRDIITHYVYYKIPDFCKMIPRSVNFKIKYYDGDYDTDSYYSVEASYEYSQNYKVLGKTYVDKKKIDIPPKKVFEILTEAFHKEGYKLEFGYYEKNCIVFNLEKEDEKLLVL